MVVQRLRRRAAKHEVASSIPGRGSRSFDGWEKQKRPFVESSDQIKVESCAAH